MFNICLLYAEICRYGIFVRSSVSCDRGLSWHVMKHVFKFELFFCCMFTSHPVKMYNTVVVHS